MRSLVAAAALVALTQIGCSDDDASGGDTPADGGGGVGGGGAAGGGAGGATGGGGSGGVGYAGAARYRHDEISSPLTDSVADAMRAIAARDGTLTDDVFMKVGASGTVNSHFMSCFAASMQYTVDLDGRDELQSSLDFFRGGDAAGDTPFDRVTLAAEVGRTASWVVSGSPSPLEQEISAITPRFALVNYGTNDMQQGVTHRSALFPFYDNFNALLDELETQGIVPIVTGLNPRSDSTVAARWVPSYDVVTRGIAEARQLPYISLYNAMVGLPSMGLISDGIHGNAYQDPNEGSQPCWFSSGPLQFNYNSRNLLTLQALDGVRDLVLGGAVSLVQAEPWIGDGTASAPIVIDRLPFTHAGDTSASTESALDSYPLCDSGQNESGPEIVYRLELQQAAALRILALDRQGADVDVHLLGDAPTADGCLQRDDRVIERTLPAGAYHIVVDTFVTSGSPQAGPYLLAVLTCEPGDPDC
jgi:hypothetical protein